MEMKDVLKNVAKVKAEHPCDTVREVLDVLFPEVKVQQPEKLIVVIHPFWDGGRTYIVFSNQKVDLWGGDRKVVDWRREDILRRHAQVYNLNKPGIYGGYADDLQAALRAVEQLVEAES